MRYGFRSASLSKKTAVYDTIIDAKKFLRRKLVLLATNGAGNRYTGRRDEMSEGI